MKRALSLLAAAVLAVPLSSQAAMTFKFDADGAGTAFSAVDADVFDFAPGSALSMSGNPAGGIDVGDVTKLLYQANLTALLSNGSVALANGASNAGTTVRFTAVLGFKEVATAATANSVSFEFAGANALSADNFFYIYRVTTLADNLNGTGFVSATPVLSGHVSGISSSSFTVTGSTLPALDQNGTNNWPGTTTIVGTGSTDLNLTIDSVNAAYFPDLMTGTAVTLGFVNSSLVDPFKQTDPSKHFSSNGTSNGNYATNLGPVNGFNTSTSGATYDFIFQADANMSFAVPEPGSVGLIGLALTAMGLTARRRRSAK